MRNIQQGLLDYASIAWEKTDTDPTKTTTYDDILTKFDTLWDNNNNLMYHTSHIEIMWIHTLNVGLAQSSL